MCAFGLAKVFFEYVTAGAAKSRVPRDSAKQKLLSRGTRDFLPHKDRRDDVHSGN